MRTIYLLIFAFILLGNSCKSNSPQKADSTVVKANDGVEILQDTLVGINNGELVFANGKRKALPFADDADATQLILVRHAEKATGGEDPEDPDLTPAGSQRAERLADILQEFPLDGVYTTFYNRSTSTAQPSAYQAQVDIQFYEANQSADFVIQLAARQMGKHFLVVGHSNTVPQMLNRLLGEAKFKDLRDSEYSNIYVASISKDGQVEVIRALF